MADNTTQYVYVDDAGAISLSTDEFLETPDKIQIGVATDEGASIVSTFGLGVRLEESIGQAGRFIRRVHGITRDSRKGGLIFGQSGDANRDVSITAGSLWWGRTEYPFASFNTSGADTFETYSATGQESAAASLWPNEQFDSAGTLTTLTNNRWANLFFFIIPDNGVIMVYGRAEFTTEGGADNEGVPTTSLPTKISETSILAARFTFQKSVNTATVSSAFEQLFANAGVTDHGNLAGLLDDDHTQYILVDGSRAFSGNQDFGTNDITGVGSLGVTGTRLTKGWFTDLEVTNAIAGSITGNAATVSTITGIAPDTQNTYARTQYLIPYADTTTSFAGIAIGTVAQVLTSNGVGVAPTFQDAAGGGASANFETLTGDKALVGGTDDQIQVLDANGANRVIELSAVSTTDSIFEIKNNSDKASAFYLEIKDGIAGTAMTRLFFGATAIYVFDGSNWEPLTPTGGATNNDERKQVNYGAWSRASSGSAAAYGYNARATGAASLAMGPDTNATSTQAIAIGNLAQATTGTTPIAIGKSSLSSGTSSIAIGNTAQANAQANAIAIGPFSKVLAAESISMGFHSDAERFGEIWFGMDSSSPNDVGMGSIVWYDVVTAGAGATEFFVKDNSTNRYTLQSSEAVVLPISCVAIDFTAGEYMTWAGDVSGFNNAGTTTVVDNLAVKADPSTNAWTLAFSADDTNDAVIPSFTPDATNNTEVACCIGLSCNLRS